MGTLYRRFITSQALKILLFYDYQKKSGYLSDMTGGISLCQPEKNLHLNNLNNESRGLEKVIEKPTETIMNEIENVWLRKTWRDIIAIKTVGLHKIIDGDAEIYIMPLNKFKWICKHKLCGVYLILNTTNGKYYIGSSNHIIRRWSKHLNDLKKKIHHNIHLQRAFNQYKPEKFEFIFIKNVSPESLIKSEQIYLDVAKAEKEFTYNISFTADRPEMTEAMKCKISSGIINAYKNNPALGERASELKKLFFKNHPQAVIDNRMRVKQSYIDDPNLKRLSSERMKRFFDNPASRKHLSDKAKSRYKNNPLLGKQIGERNKLLYSGHGNPRYDEACYNFYNIVTKESYVGTRYDFYKKYDINKNDVGKIINCPGTFTTNWCVMKKLKDKDELNEIMKKFTNKHVIHSFTNTITRQSFTGKPSEFRKQYNLHQSCVSALVRRVASHHKDWILSAI